MESTYARTCTEGWISNGSVQARPALSHRFRADGLQVTVADDGKGTTGVIWQKR